MKFSNFLEGTGLEPGRYHLAAHQRVWPGPWTEKAEYGKGEGATGYAIQTGRAVRIVDLNRYAEDEAGIQREYPGIAWSDSLRIRDRAKDYFAPDDGDSSPPLSFLCAPIKSGEDAIGAIRCAGSRRNPFYFDTWQARLLETVGSRVGPWWQNILRRQRTEREISSWEELTRGFETMNKYAQRQINKQSWDEGVFFREAMLLAHKVIPGTNNSDVRLVEGDELRTVATHGSDWNRFAHAKTARYAIPAGSQA